MHSEFIVQGLPNPPAPPVWQVPCAQCSPVFGQLMSATHCTQRPAATVVSQKLPAGSPAQSSSIAHPTQLPETQLLLDEHWPVSRHSTQSWVPVSQKGESEPQSALLAHPTRMHCWFW